MKFEYALIGVLGFLVLSIIGLVYSDPYDIPLFSVPYDKSELFEMHDIIVDGTISVFNDDLEQPFIVIRVYDYYKNPKNVLQMTVWGDFAQNSEFCLRNDYKCSRILAYLYEDENGRYLQGEYFAWITDECDARCHLGQ